MIKQISSIFAELERKTITQYGLLTGITLLAAALRFYKLGDWSFWIDEIFTINRAQVHYGSFGAILQYVPPANNWIPLSVMLTAGALNFLGVNEWSARLVPAVIGILSIPILYFPTKKIFGIQVTLIALLLLAISPWHIFWSQNARFYSSLLLLYTLALFSFFFWIEKDRFIYLLSFFLLLYFATSERFIAIFILPVIACYLFFLWILPFEKPEGFRKRNIIFLLIPFIAVVIFEGFNYSMKGHFRIFGGFDWFFQYQSDNPIVLAGNISFYLGIPLMVLAIFSGIYLLIKKNHSGLLMFSGAVVPVVILLAINPFIFTKDRYVFATLFWWIILAAYGINELLKSTKGMHRWLSVAVLMVLVLGAASDNLLYFRVNYGNRGEWKTAFNIIKERGQQEDAVVAYWPEFGPYYLGREVIAYEEIDIATILSSEKRYWFVLDAETIWANRDLKIWLENNARLIDIRYLRTPDDFFLRIYLFDPKQFTAP